MRGVGNGRSGRSVCAREPILTAENKLWRAVLEQALDDAELTECPEIAWEPALRIQARRYLRADEPAQALSLKLVCEFAEVPADRVILWARRRYPRHVTQIPAGAAPCKGAGLPCPSRGACAAALDQHPDRCAVN